MTSGPAVESARSIQPTSRALWALAGRSCAAPHLERRTSRRPSPGPHGGGRQRRAPARPASRSAAVLTTPPLAPVAPPPAFPARRPPLATAPAPHPLIPSSLAPAATAPIWRRR